MKTSDDLLRKAQKHRIGPVLGSILAVAVLVLTFGAIYLALVLGVNADSRQTATFLLIPALLALPHVIVGLRLAYGRKSHDRVPGFWRSGKWIRHLFRPRTYLVQFGLNFMSILLLFYGVALFFTRQSYVLGATLILIGEGFAVLHARRIGKSLKEIIFAPSPGKDD